MPFYDGAARRRRDPVVFDESVRDDRSDLRDHLRCIDALEFCTPRKIEAHRPARRLAQERQTPPAQPAAFVCPVRRLAVHHWLFVLHVAAHRAPFRRHVELARGNDSRERGDGAALLLAFGLPAQSGANGKAALPARAEHVLPSSARIAHQFHVRQHVGHRYDALPRAYKRMRRHWHRRRHAEKRRERHTMRCLFHQLLRHERL